VGVSSFSVGISSIGFGGGVVARVHRGTHFFQLVFLILNYSQFLFRIAKVSLITVINNQESLSFVSNKVGPVCRIEDQKT
jgi:hypothetical protein